MNEKLFEEIEGFLNEKSGEEKTPLFTDSEYEFIIASLAMSRGDRGFTEDEAEALLKWCDMVRINQALVDLLLKGLAIIGWENDEPTFIISELGKKVLEE